VAAPSPEITVVHLVWAPLGGEVIERFVHAYRTRPAGREHELAVIFNGFDGADDPRLKAAEAQLEGLDYQRILTAGSMLDLAAYRHAASVLDTRMICLLNSYSRPLSDGWLSMMARAAAGPAVGLLGASGSWGSRSSHVRYAAGFGGPYASVYDSRASMDRAFATLSGEQAPPSPGRGPAQLLRRRLDLVTSMARHAVWFPAFPAAHVRTNAVLVERLLWLEICRDALHDKQATYRLESGRKGIMSRLTGLGLKAVVVGRDGQAYESGHWPESLTFWQGDQENLLIGDNQTRIYDEAEADMRLALARYAWGRRAKPGTAPIAGES